MLRTYLDGAVFGSTAGDGAPGMLLLHGWRRSARDFDGVAAALAGRGVASLAVDLPGFGASPPPSAAMGARGYASLLGPLVEAMADEGPIVVVGHSFGGRVAVCLAAAAPDRVARLVLTGVPLVRDAMPRVTPARAYRVIRALAARSLIPNGALEAARRRYGSDDYRAASGVMRDVLVATVQESYEAELAKLRCDTTLLWGALDTTAPVAVARAAATITERAHLELLDGVGHLVPTEAPEALAAAAVVSRESAR